MMTRKDRLGRVRRATQDTSTLARAGASSRSHNVNMSEPAHAAFAALTPMQRGDLITAALKPRD